MSIYGGRFKGNVTFDNMQDKYNNTALRARQVDLQAQAQADSNSRFNAEMAHKSQAFEFNKQQSLLKQQSDAEAKKVNEARYQQELAFRKEKFAFDTDKYNKGVELDAERYQDKRDDMQFNRGLIEDNQANKDRDFALRERSVNSNIANTEADNKLQSERLQITESKYLDIKKSRDFRSSLSAAQVEDGGILEAPDSWKEQDQNLAGITSVNGDRYAIMNDGKKVLVDDYLRSMSGGSRSNGRSIAPRQRRSNQSGGKTTQPKPFKTSPAFMGAYFSDVDDQKKSKVSRIYDSLSRNYDIDESTAQYIAGSIKGLVNNETLDFDSLDALAKGAVTKLDPKNAEHSQILAIKEMLESEHGIVSKKEQYFKGKSYQPTVDSTDTPQDMQYAKSNLGYISKVSTNMNEVKEQSKVFMDKVRSGDVDNSSAQQQLLIMRQQASQGGESEAYQIALKNLQADVKQVRENDQYIPWDRSDMSAIVNENDSEYFEKDHIGRLYDGMLVNSKRRDGKDGGTRGAMEDVKNTIIEAQAYIDSGKSAGDEADLKEKQELVSVGLEKMANYLSKNSENDTHASIWLAELAHNNLTGRDAGLLDKLEMPNKKSMINQGAKGILGKELRRVMLNEGADKVDIGDIINNAEMSSKYPHVALAVNVLQKHNDGTAIFTEITNEAKGANPAFTLKNRWGNDDIQVSQIVKEKRQEQEGRDKKLDATDAYGDIGTDLAETMTQFEDEFLPSQKDMMRNIDYANTGSIKQVARGIRGIGQAIGLNAPDGITVKNNTENLNNAKRESIKNFKDEILPAMQSSEDLSRFISRGSQLLNDFKEIPNLRGEALRLEGSAPSKARREARLSTIKAMVDMAKKRLKAGVGGDSPLTYLLAPAIKRGNTERSYN